MADTTLTIETYLQGKVAFEIDDTALTAILFDRDINASTLVSEITKKELELCQADLFMWYLTMPSKSASVKDADGNWSHETGSSEMSVADRKALRDWANDVYARYGETVSVKQRINFFSKGLRTW